jgi:hypothetical protein
LVNYGNTLTVEGTGRAGKASTANIDGKALDAYRGKRANKGQVIDSKIKPTGLN